MPKPPPPEATKPTPTEATGKSKRYDEAFKRQAVENWIRSGKPGTQIARELACPIPASRNGSGDPGAMPPRSAPTSAENRALRAELARVRELRDILKKSLGIFSEPPRSAIKPSTP